MKRSRVVLLVGVGLVMAACGGPGAGGGRTTLASESSTTTTIESSTTTEVSMITESDLVDAAIVDLATLLGTGHQEIQVLRVESVTWPDTALGCPQEGQMYAQMIVEGHRIVLGHGDRVYLYHSGDDEPAFLCPSEESDGGYDFVPPPGAGES